MTRYMSTKEVADYLGCHPETVRRMVLDGRLPARKRGALNPASTRDIRRLLIDAEDVEAVLEPTQAR